MKDMGEVRIKVVAMPNNTNSSGNIFGGWILSQIDSAGAIAAREVAPERVVTISMKEVTFKEPVYIGDLLSCYAKIIKVGKTSITTSIEVVVERLTHEKRKVCLHVTSAEATYVSVDRIGNKKEIDPELKKLHGF
ncbi:acyl-CoA thioesterase [Campylobacter blaseri]|uniref:Acyl-CoA thioesterase n=1 Tax=Campylobacter blaseri TaxID=2042961 RepID=A0A2P8R0J4_9BACT|nr:acyl-CoA thioesterase [Campylobacter blaseri]PSM52012.1 acyl-CoA thioesterase [Campylobacter blaseri]PSM53797.1 acyl-CoA thioesterase [Campylobacter blaseri]QKF85651.1 acyl-CoA thioesterase [Campylobacter blaseri]